MPQAQLPFFPEGTSIINANLSFMKQDDQVTYFHGHLPVFQHAIKDKKTFYLITSQFYVNGNATQAEISRAFGVSLISLKRAVKRYREKGVAGFYEEPARRGTAVLTPPVLTQAQHLFDEGYELVDVAKELSIKPDTLRKAVAAGTLHKQKKESPISETNSTPSTKSDRSRGDAQAPMGMGATNTMGRVAASIGLLNNTAPTFETSLDIPHAGV